MERKFKMETDELRKEETQFMNAGCQLEREKQLMDKKQKLQNQIVEEQVYAKLWMLDAEKKAQREQREFEQNKRKVQETVNILTWQTEQRANQNEFEKQSKMREQQMLNEQWQRELQMDKNAEHQKFILNRERNLELIKHNEAERELRQAQEAAEKARDKQLLEAALAREKALADIEEAEKLKRRQEVIELQKYYK